MINITKFKEKLEAELVLVENELKKIGIKHSNGNVDWQAVPTDMDSDSADSNEVADEIESYEENTAVLKQLEIQYNEIKNALKRIEDGTYGKCEVGGEDIPEDRLEANPSAKTCIEHSK
jgi:RNA polymerase-binding transcription factor DksA